MNEADGLVVIYDDSCSLCRAAARWLERHSSRANVQLVPIADDLAVRGLRLSRPALEVEMHVVDARGNVHRGFRAWRRIARDVSVLRPVWPFLWLPGVAPIGSCVYRWVAAHRGLLSRALHFDRRDTTCSCGPVRGR